MALINRISRLIRADVHAVLDNLEEPELLLKQAVREMEEELVASERRIGLGAHEQERLAGRIGELESSVVQCQQQLDLCFESGKDELAKQLLRKQLEAERLLQRLRARQQATDRELEQQRKRLAEHRATLESLRQKAELFAPAADAGERSGGFDALAWPERQLTVSDAEVEIAFLREKSQRGAA